MLSLDVLVHLHHRPHQTQHPDTPLLGDIFFHSINAHLLPFLFIILFKVVTKCMLVVNPVIACSY